MEVHQCFTPHVTMQGCQRIARHELGLIVKLYDAGPVSDESLEAARKHCLDEIHKSLEAAELSYSEHERYWQLVKADLEYWIAACEDRVK